MEIHSLPWKINFKKHGTHSFRFCHRALPFSQARGNHSLKKDSLMNGLLRFPPPAGEDPGQEE